MRYILLLTISLIHVSLQAQHSVARRWNELNLEAIRNDFARPTIHARNLFHISAAMYDAWAITSDKGKTYLIGNNVHGFNSEFEGFKASSGNEDDNVKKAINYAALRLLQHRYSDSPQIEDTEELILELVQELTIDPSFTSTDYSTGSAAALGNYIAQEYIKYGLQDGSNEINDYENTTYQPVNSALFPEQIALDSTLGNPSISNPNRWQPLEFSTFIDQSGEITNSAVPTFLSPEWGQVAPFSLSRNDVTIYERDNFDYLVYHDPGPPPYHNPDDDPEGTALYQWNFSLVAIWSGHLDSGFDREIDISPRSIGNFNSVNFPVDLADHPNFYNYLEGGDASLGREINPFTNEPYPEQKVKLGDYGRILAEFWADGPDSETPPGHWFTILNYVNDNLKEKRFNGQGPILEDLEWDIKSYFLLGGTMHDVAISAWGIKGWYDYIRPISAIRYMADLGQSSDPTLANYNPGGLPLVDNYIELITEDDPISLRGKNNQNLGEIKIYAWRGPGSLDKPFIENPETDQAGVDWILATQWWPYQRPTFITPPFAGYVSGHSTYSRAAAELLTLITGSTYFPNGLGEFIAEKNEFLIFEEGPSEDITLQWATYQDASDQCSLSRIWGGIHPPADDIPGRIIGQTIGQESFLFGSSYFEDIPLTVNAEIQSLIYPNPNTGSIKIKLPYSSDKYDLKLYDLTGKVLYTKSIIKTEDIVNIEHLPRGKYLVRVKGKEWDSSHYIVKK